MRRLFAETAIVQLFLTAGGTLLAGLFGGVPAAVGVGAGGALATADLAAIAGLSAAIATGRMRNRVVCFTALTLKFPALAGLLYLLVVHLDLHVVGLLAGVSTMLPAVAYAALRHRTSAPAEAGHG